jgi:hypothetical protein
LKEVRETLVFYESPHRILETLKDIFDILGDREMVLTRELTKVYEEILRRKVSEIQTQIGERQLKVKSRWLFPEGCAKRTGDTGGETRRGSFTASSSDLQVYLIFWTSLSCRSPRHAIAITLALGTIVNRSGNISLMAITSIWNRLLIEALQSSSP